MLLTNPKSEIRNPKNVAPVSSCAFRRSSGPRAFTLIEVMVVVGIIVILAGIGLVVGSAVKRRAAESQTKTTMEALRHTMSIYLSNHAEPASGTSVFVAALLAQDRIAISSLPGATKSPPEIDDGFGNKMQYVRSDDPNNKSKAGFFLSAGPDGDFTTTADNIPSSPVGN